LVIHINGAVVEFLVAWEPLRVDPTRKLGFFDGLQDWRFSSIGKGDEESDIFFNVTAVNGQDGIGNVFL
jgi:hypothetical protein